MQRFNIWARDHKQWWGPNHCGYTPYLAEAGHYSLAEIGDILCGDALCEQIVVDSTNAEQLKEAGK